MVRYGLMAMSYGTTHALSITFFIRKKVTTTLPSPDCYSHLKPSILHYKTSKLMKYNFLGNTGLVVSELCFGTMTFGGGVGIWEAMGKTQQKEVNELMKDVVDAAINFIDTANVYSRGQSEQLLGQSLKDTGLSRNQLVIATKVRGRMGDGRNDVGLSRYHIFQSVDESLQRLQMDHIDILYVHGVDPKPPVEEIGRSLNDIVLTGKV